MPFVVRDLARERPGREERRALAARALYATVLASPPPRSVSVSSGSESTRRSSTSRARRRVGFSEAMTGIGGKVLSWVVQPYTGCIALYGTRVPDARPPSLNLTNADVRPFPMTDTDRGLSRAQVEKQLDASLKRLRTDHVDLYQCHRFDFDTPLEETMEALTRAVESGKARFVSEMFRLGEGEAGVEADVRAGPGRRARSACPCRR